MVLLVGGRRYFESQVCFQGWLAYKILGPAKLTLSLVLDHTRKIPSQQRQRLPYNFHGSSFNRYQPHRRCCRQPKCFRKEIVGVWLSRWVQWPLKCSAFKDPFSKPQSPSTVPVQQARCLDQTSSLWHVIDSRLAYASNHG